MTPTQVFEGLSHLSLTLFQRPRCQTMAGGNLEAVSVPRGVICMILTPARKISAYQLMLCQINGAISPMLPWNCLFPVVSRTQSLLPSPRSLSSPVPMKVLPSFLPAGRGDTTLTARPPGLPTPPSESHPRGPAAPPVTMFFLLLRA